MDAVSLFSVVTPDMFQNAGDMLDLALASCNIPPKVLANEIGYSVQAIYSAIQSIRPIPVKARQKISALNVIAAAAVALESTGFVRLFGYSKLDRHIQAMLTRVKKQNKAVSASLNELPEILLDKECRDDLTTEEAKRVDEAARQLVDHINCSLNLVMELETKFDVKLIGYLTAKENRLSGNSDGFGKNLKNSI